MGIAESTDVSIASVSERPSLPSYMTDSFHQIDKIVGEPKSGATTVDIHEGPLPKRGEPLSPTSGSKPTRGAVQRPDYAPTRSIPDNPGLEAQAVLIIRTQLLRPVLNNLEQAGKYAGTPAMSRYVDEVVRGLRQMRDIAPRDPMTFVAMALHDALTHDHNWAEYTSDQYRRAYEILRNLHSSKYFTPKAAEQGIIDLELAGFTTFPFEIIFDDEESI